MGKIKREKECWICHRKESELIKMFEEDGKLKPETELENVFGNLNSTRIEDEHLFNLCFVCLCFVSNIAFNDVREDIKKKELIWEAITNNLETDLELRIKTE